MSIIYCFCLLQLFIASSADSISNDENFVDEFTETTLQSDFVMDNNDVDAETTTDASIFEDFIYNLRDLNKDFERLGKIYVTQYYNLFDDPKRRLSLVALYHTDDSFMTYEGERYCGTKKILEKFQKLNLKKLGRKILSIDIQPLLDGSIVINVIGKVFESDKPDHLYAQTFIYKPQKGSFFLQHDIYRVIRP